MAPQLYFMLIYDIEQRHVRVEEFGSDYESAADAYTEREERFREQGQVEVVLVGADSLETIHKTHSHYFAPREEDLFERFLEGVTA